MLASRAIGCNDRLRRRTWGRRVSNQPVECVVPAGALLGECPVWSEREGLLYWVDIEGRGRPGSIALTAAPGRLLVAVEHRLAFFDWEGAAWTEWVALEPEGTGNRLNDGRCDRAGRFWVGSMFDPAAARRV